MKSVKDDKRNTTKNERDKNKNRKEKLMREHELYLFEIMLSL